MSTATCYNMTSRYDAGGMANSVTQHQTTYLRSPATPLAAAMEENSNVTHRVLDSPASIYSSSCASGELSQRTSTESSVDEDSQSRFHLSFNSESEMIVSDTTSDSDYQEMTSQALPNLKAISKKQSRKRPNALSPIIISSDDQVSPTPPSVMKGLSAIPSAVPLTISVPLNQIKLSSKEGDMTTPTPPVDVSDSSTTAPGTPLRTPISLKLKRSPVSNKWQSFIVTANHDTACCITTGMDMVTTKETDSNELNDTMASSPCVVEIDAPDDTLSVVSGISLMDNTSTTSCSLSSTVESRCGEQEALVSTPKSCLPGDGAIDSVFSFDDMLSVTSISSSDSCFTLDKAYSRTRPSSSSSRKRSRAPPSNKPSINRNFSFESLFTGTPELILRNGLLVPAHSLALKGKLYAPRDHPIHTWSNGTPVTNLPQNNKPPSDKPSS